MSTVSAQTADRPPAPKALLVGLWSVQALVSLVFTGTGLWKLLTPLPELATMIPWAGQVPEAFLHATAILDLCGGIGILLPALVRVKPGLSVLAAAGCAALQVCAIVFHFARGEAASTPFNFFLVGLSLFVAWGRRYKAPIPPRV